jgi:hypothetical protein
MGTILAGTSITYGDSSTVIGRGLAKAAVSFTSGVDATLPGSPFPAPAAALTQSPSAIPSMEPTFRALSPTPQPTIATMTSISVQQSIRYMNII